MASGNAMLNFCEEAVIHAINIDNLQVFCCFYVLVHLCIITLRPYNMESMATLEKSLESFNQGDWETYRALVADNCQYFEYATGRVVKSGDDFVSNSKS